MWLSSHSTCILKYLYIIGTFSLKFIMIRWVLTFCHTNFVWGTVVLVTFSYSGEGGRPRAKQNKKKCNTLLTHTYRKKKDKEIQEQWLFMVGVLTVPSWKSSRVCAHRRVYTHLLAIMVFVISEVLGCHGFEASSSKCWPFKQTQKYFIYMWNKSGNSNKMEVKECQQINSYNGLGWL